MTADETAPVEDAVEGEVETDTVDQDAVDDVPVDEAGAEDVLVEEAPVEDDPEPTVTPMAFPLAAPAPLPDLQGPPSARLAQLGIDLPEVPRPLAAYVPATRTGDLVYTSGQLPVVDGVLPMTGVIGDEAVDVTPAEGAALARICAVNAVAAVASLVDLDSVRRVVKVVVFVASAPGFAGQPEVANGASILLQQVFGDDGVHARSAVGVSALPRNSPVEVEVIIEVGDAALP